MPREISEREERFYAQFVTSIGVLIMAGALLHASISIYLITTGERAEGRVVQYDAYARSRSSGFGSSSMPITSYNPIVIYTDYEGKEKSLRHNVGSNFKFYDRNETVTVIYNKGQPRIARILGFGPLAMPVVILSIFSGIFLLFGRGMRRFYARKYPTGT